MICIIRALCTGSDCVANENCPHDIFIIFLLVSYGLMYFSFLSLTHSMAVFTRQHVSYLICCSRLQGILMVGIRLALKYIF